MIESSRELSNPSRVKRSGRVRERKSFDRIDGGSRQLDEKLEEDER
jgi:hypothetical protein